MRELSVSLLTGGELVLERGGKLQTRMVPKGTLHAINVDVSWWSYQDAMAFLEANALAWRNDAEASRWAEALKRRRQVPWLTVIADDGPEPNEMAGVVRDLLLCKEDAEHTRVELAADVTHLYRGDKIVVTFSRMPGMPGISKKRTVAWLNTPEQTYVLAVVGALKRSGCRSIQVDTLGGNREECVLDEPFSVKCVLQMLGVVFPLPASFNWCGLPQLFVRPGLGGEVGRIAVPF